MASSIEKALLDRARPYMLATRARQLMRAEVSKGCRPEIAEGPVALEPLYQPIFAEGTPDGPVIDGDCVWAPPIAAEDLCRLKVWISPLQKCEWNRSELMLKHLLRVRHRVGLEMLGNQEGVTLQLMCHRRDVPIVRAAMAGQFEQCELTPVRGNPLGSVSDSAWARAVFYDCYPPPPYSHPLTNPEELDRSPYAPLMTAMAQLPPGTLGLYQVVFAPVDPSHNWHRNVQTLLDLEYAVKLMGGLATAQRLVQQAPSGDLRRMAMDVETKAHNDKPFFAAALRVAVVNGGDEAEGLLESLSATCSLLQHGGRPLCYLTEEDYRRRPPTEGVAEMFRLGMTHRPGFLVNSWELASLVHIPPPWLFEHLCPTVRVLETLSPDGALSLGTPIGYCDYADQRQPVCIPTAIRSKSVHLIGRPGMGKSTVLESMILHDIARGDGIAVLDPHGQLVQRILCLIPPEHIDRVIFLDPGDPDWVPLWNPLHCSGAQSPGRVADDLVRAFKSFVTGWGDRLEHLLRHALLAVLHLSGGSLLDVSNILRPKSPQSRQLRALALQVMDNEVARLFWRNDFDRYRSADLAPAQHKLSKLLTSGTVSLMLSQSDTSFDLQDVMDSGKILLVDLSTIGPEVRGILGCFTLSLMHMTALGRSRRVLETLAPFHVYCDEAHRFMTDAIEDLIAETRKFNVSLVLAHQYLSQFDGRKADALSSVGSTIIFNVDTRDAQHLRKDLQGLADVDDLITLEVGQAIARIGTHVVRVHTTPPLEMGEDHCRDQIIAQSRAKYYRPIEEVRRDIRDRDRRWSVAPTPQADPVGPRRQEGAVNAQRDSTLTPRPGGASKVEEFIYDVF